LPSFGHDLSGTGIYMYKYGSLRMRMNVDKAMEQKPFPMFWEDCHEKDFIVFVHLDRYVNCRTW